MAYRFLINTEKKLSTNYPRFFFNDQRFLNEVKDARLLTFTLLHNKEDKILADASFHIKNGKAVSPLRGSFGSFQFSDSLALKDLNNFIQDVETALIEHGAETVTIRNYPLCYAPVQTQILASLLPSLGYNLKYSDLNFHIDTHTPFEKSLRESESARLKALQNAGFEASLWTDPDLELVFDILKKCRDQKGYPMSLSLNDFSEMFLQFPEEYTVFKVSKDNQVVAVAVNVKVNSEILYNFYLGELAEFRVHSPVVLLLKAIFEYAQEHAYKMLDLGIGTDKGEPNFGLIHFKQNLGGIPSLKPMFEKKLQ